MQQKYDNFPLLNFFNVIINVYIESDSILLFVKLNNFFFNKKKKKVNLIDDNCN